jgi:polyisoprenoid-binding protein YceI
LREQEVSGRRYAAAGALCALALFLAACGNDAPPAEGAPPPVAAAPALDLPAGEYRLDPSHASLVFGVDHLGFAQYVGSFRRFDATLILDPANPESARLEATVDIASLDVPAPPAGFLDTLLGADWFDAARAPTMAYRSTAVTLTGDNTARIDGELTFRGVTRPASLRARFNGGWAGHPYDPNARIGFSASGAILRSEFGMDIGLPAPPDNLGVGDRVEIVIEAEFTGPAWSGAAASGSAP